jgi:hypothetical protein
VQRAPPAVLLEYLALSKGVNTTLRAIPRDYVYGFVKVNLANIKRKLYPIDSVKDSLNLVALYFSIFALHFWIVCFTLYSVRRFTESVGLAYTFYIKSILESS